MSYILGGMKQDGAISSCYTQNSVQFKTSIFLALEVSM